MSNEFYCKICDIPCNGKAPFEQHLDSAKHLKKAKIYESQATSEQPTPKDTSTPPPTTNTYTSSPTANTRAPFTTTNDTNSEDSSISPVSVSISPETMRILLEWNHPAGYKPYCDICQLPLHGENNAEIHFNPSNNIHDQKLAAWKQIRESGAKYSCKICSEIFSNENIMREHFNSVNHENTRQQKLYLEKFIRIYEAYNNLKQVRKQAKELESVVDNSLVNPFQKLNIIDATEPKIKSPDLWRINPAMLQEAMDNKHNEDDY